MDETKEMLREEFREAEARHDYARLFLDSSIALQIKSLRLQRDWTQKELAEEAGLHQSQISKLEQISSSSWTLETLKKLAKAFDLRLRVSFESFGTLLDEYVSQNRERFERPSFANDPAFATPIPDREFSFGVRGGVVSLHEWRIRDTAATPPEGVGAAEGEPTEVFYSTVRP